jgi:hypothetical protein
MNGKCPSCGQRIGHVDLERGPVGNGVVGPLVAGYVAVCPTFSCRAVLGVMADPDAIAKKVIEAITGKKPR